MKMTREHYEFLKEAIKKNESKVIFRFDCTLSDMRYRWDLLHISVPSKWICDNLYPYLNDDHIDTALKSITGRKEK